MRKFFVALEAEEIPPVEAKPEEVLENTVNVEEAHDDVVAETEEVSEMEGAVQEGTEASDTLVDLSGAMQEKVADGEGLSEDAAKVAEITIESIRVRLGMPKSIGRMPSMESFKSPRSRVEATKIALEATEGTFAKLWERIKAICSSIGESIKKFIANLLNNYGMLKKHLVVLQTKAKALKGAPEKADLDKGSLAKFFSQGGKADAGTAEACLGTIAKFSGMADKVLEHVKSIDLSAIVSNPASASEKVKDAHTQMTSAALSSGIKSGDTLPGDQIFTVGIKEGSFTFELTPGKESAKTIKTLSQGDMDKLLALAITQAEKGPDVKKVSEAADTSLKAIVKAADTIIKSIGKLNEKKDDKEGPKTVKEASALANSLVGVISKVSSKLPALHFATVKAVADYVSASMSVYKEPKAAAEKEAAEKAAKEAADKK